MNGDDKALSAALGTDMQPAPFKEPDYGKLRTLPQVFAEQKRVGDLQAEAAGELKKAELTQQTNLATEQAKAATQVADKTKSYVEDNQRKEAEFPYPEFHPTRDNAESLGGLFSIVSTLGIMLGSSGKQSGLNAMNAMSGMMTGWQKGRADLFKREKEEFDKEFNRIKVLREGLRKDLEDYMKLLPYDKESAMYKAAEISAKTGSDSIINAYVKNGKAQNALQLLDSAAKLIEKEEERRAKAAEKTQKFASDRFGFGDIVATASNEAAASLSNLVMMPAETTAGIFGGRQTTSLFTAPLDALLNTTITSENTQRYNAEINNLGKFIAQVQKGGRQVTNADIEQTGRAFRIEEGDAPLTVLTKLAQARQSLDRALDVRIASPNTPDPLREVYKQNKRDIEASVPFTVKDVNNFANQRDKNKTFGDMFTEYGMTSSQPSSGQDTSATAGNWTVKEK